MDPLTVCAAPGLQAREEGHLLLKDCFLEAASSSCGQQCGQSKAVREVATDKSETWEDCGISTQAQLPRHFEVTPALPRDPGFEASGSELPVVRDLEHILSHQRPSAAQSVAPLNFRAP